MINEYVKKWLINANNDLKVAINLMKLSSEETVTEAICFHSQQAVEKFLKAYLITKNVEFRKTHNLEYLLELCIKKDDEFKGNDAGDLSLYYKISHHNNNINIVLSFCCCYIGIVRVAI